MFSRLRDDLGEMRARHGLIPDVVLVTGDLAETGKPAEFKQFRGFAEALIEHLGLPRRRLAMIPGNHDINRLACDAYFKDCESEDRTPKLPYWPKLRHFAAMFAEFYAGEPDITFTETSPFSEFRYPDLGLVIAGLNSTIAESHRPDDHHGFLGEPQLRHFAGVLRAAADEGLLRIAAVHHHPIHPEGDPARQDLKDLRRFLGPYLSLVVHGHIHEDEFNYLDGGTPIPVLGVGSAGVKLAQRPEEVPNQYQWIRIHADCLEYGSRAYVPDQKRWVGDLRPDRDGERWWQRRPVALDRVSTLATSPAIVAAAPETALARDIASYRASLARQLRRRILLCDLATYGEDSDLATGLDLLKIFVPQLATQEIPRTDRPRAARDPDHVEFVPLTTSPPRSIDTIVVSEAHPWTLILGTPGAGKTTLTSWVALKLASDGEQLPGVPSEFVPVRIELRLFVERWSAAHAAGKSYEFFDYLDDVHREESRPLRAEALRHLGESGRLLWLFDGLDEVASDAHRRTIADMILGVRERHGGRGLVTGRIVGCRPLQSHFHDAAIHCFTLLDLTDAQIARFLERWHVLAFPGAADLAARRHERLRQTLANNTSVRDLAGNPLLLTLIALLNRGDELPHRRHKLLERAADLMLSQWEANKNLPHPNATRFDLADKRRFLAELAWHMLTAVPGGSGNAIESDDLLRFTQAFCARRFQASPDIARLSAHALLDHLRERNYVLGLLGGQTFGFLHKAFLEYFAAEEAYHRFRTHQWQLTDLEHLFRKRWRDHAWFEVLVLVCALLAEDQSEHSVALLRAVLADTAPWDLSIPPRFAEFAVRCVADSPLGTGVAHNFALALNRYLWAYYSQSASIYLIDLSESFQHVRGEWPTLSQSLTKRDDMATSGPATASFELLLAGRDNRFYEDLLVPRLVAHASEGLGHEFWRPWMDLLFGITHPRSAEPWLRREAESAQPARFRCIAVFLLHERERLQLLANDDSEEVRRTAQALLDLLQARDDLLQVGRLRRGVAHRAGIRVGTIEELYKGGTRFCYDPQYLERADSLPIAPTLPLRAEPYDHPALHPVFEGLLPQGWLLNIDLERYQLKPGDQFGLLLATGRDTIGAIEVLPEEEP